MTERFKNAYDALTKAFFEGTLAKWSCACCAVGNIVAHSTNEQLTPEEFKKLTRLVVVRGAPEVIKANRIMDSWRSIFGEPYNSPGLEYLEGEVASTGYTGGELAQVELAFETNTRIKVQQYRLHTEEELLLDQYNGLVAVFEVLCKLDNIDTVDYKSELQKKEGLVLA